MLGILEKGGRDHLVKEIVKSGVKFDKCIAGQHFVKLIGNVDGVSAPQQQQKKQFDGKRKWLSFVFKMFILIKFYLILIIRM